MPLKLAAVLQRSKDHPDQINQDILDYHECCTHGNRYVGIYLEENPLEDFEKRLHNYVSEMGFTDKDIILVDAEWDGKPEEAKEGENFAIPEPPQPNRLEQPWAGVAQAVWNKAVEKAGEVIWDRN